MIDQQAYLAPVWRANACLACVWCTLNGSTPVWTTAVAYMPASSRSASMAYFKQLLPLLRWQALLPHATSLRLRNCQPHSVWPLAFWVQFQTDKLSGVRSRTGLFICPPGARAASCIQHAHTCYFHSCMAGMTGEVHGAAWATHRHPA